MDDAINLDLYFPYFLGTVSNKWTSTSSRAYLRDFGVGISEWRVLASLATLDSASSNEVAQLTAMDPAAVSRSIAKLEDKGLAIPVEGKFAGRTKPFTLTPSGRDLMLKIKDSALKREERLLEGISREERDRLLQTMRKIMANLDTL